MAELQEANKLHGNVTTCTGRTLRHGIENKHSWDRRTIRAYNQPLKENAGFIHLQGSLFDSAIMKTLVISDAFRKRFLQDPGHLNTFECKVRVFDGPEDYNQHLDDEAPGESDQNLVLVMHGAGPVGYPGAPEVVNMHAPASLLKLGIRELPCIGDGRQSGTSGSPSILHATPEAAAGGNLAILRNGDMLRIDLDARRVDLLLTSEEIQSRRAEMEDKIKQLTPECQTPWRDIFRRETTQLDQGMVLKRAVKYQRIADQWPLPRHNH
ncbi:hypothetical protein PFICI_12033 [Pestalotiopsis fici W106-1]|uniref:Dihydroxy-acid/6-phosphogluconate dehydratase C-terminal domain-containing protein n=1 Tax=Pestalotiopsis fici (strain W106-1 / CGMCC3.15140) TaxID=1229662 RepID=W3WUW2_PESFW|nr:uncharacterized protein PFICI_12033 [Pestalotiopsis fici W106-1]ETS76646.1 hypothetical protein PFICI_12033 [Pestalotiopsis fici W106-1]